MSNTLIPRSIMKVLHSTCHYDMLYVHYMYTHTHTHTYILYISYIYLYVIIKIVTPLYLHFFIFSNFLHLSTFTFLSNLLCIKRGNYIKTRCSTNDKDKLTINRVLTSFLRSN